MGRHSEYRPQFSEEELEQARKGGRQHHAPYTLVRRAQLALYLAQHPETSSVRAARDLGLAVQTVRKCRRRWARQGFFP